jgi:uncharacterized DUF497 family protein
MRPRLASSLAKHGITFNAAAVALAAPGAVLRPDDRRDYGELRWIALVETEITLLTIVLNKARGSHPHHFGAKGEQA